MTIRYNPYIVGDSVEDEHFYGRRNLLAEIDGQTGKVVHLLGMRRIGKTSLLKRLAALHDHVLYLNLQGCGGSWQAFERELQRIVRRGRRRWNWLPDEAILQDEHVSTILHILDEYAQDHHEQLWLLFDEVETLITLGQADTSALQMFQSAIWSTTAIKMVFASAKQLTELDDMTTQVAYGTPFLNHFPPPIYVGNLTCNEAMSLICQSQSNHYVSVPDKTVEAICAWTNNHPFYIQCLCHFLWRSNPDPSQWLVDDMSFELTPHLDRMLRYDFDYLSMPERRIIQSVLWDEKLPNTHYSYVQGLQWLGYLKQEATGYEIGNDFLKNWLLDLPEEAWLARSYVSASSTLRMYRKGQTEYPVHGEEGDQATDTTDDILTCDSFCDVAGARYGKNRDLTLRQVQDIVSQCRAFMDKGGKVPEFHRRYSHDNYSLETLRSWLRDKRFCSLSEDHQ
jgi:hypothetical protein